MARSAVTLRGWTIGGLEGGYSMPFFFFLFLPSAPAGHSQAPCLCPVCSRTVDGMGAGVLGQASGCEQSNRRGAMRQGASKCGRTRASKQQRFKRLIGDWRLESAITDKLSRQGSASSLVWSFRTPDNVEGSSTSWSLGHKSGGRLAGCSAFAFTGCCTELCVVALRCVALPCVALLCSAPICKMHSALRLCYRRAKELRQV